MKNQNDFIVAGAFLFVAIVVSLIFLFKTRTPDAVPTVPTIVTEDARIQEASVVYSNSLPGGSDTAGGGGGGLGLGGGGAAGAVGAAGDFGGAGDAAGAGRPTMGVSR